MKDHINNFSRFCYQPSLGLLLVRFTTGLVFLMHGWQKVHSLAMVTGMMVSFGMPAWVGPFIAYVEVIGGLALILGVLPRVFGVIFGIEMVVAIFLTGLGRGYHAHEFEIVLMLLSFAIALMGSGRYALFPMECENCSGMCCRGGEACMRA